MISQFLYLSPLGILGVNIWRGVESKDPDIVGWKIKKLLRNFEYSNGSIFKKLRGLNAEVVSYKTNECTQNKGNFLSSFPLNIHDFRSQTLPLSLKKLSFLEFYRDFLPFPPICSYFLQISSNRLQFPPISSNFPHISFQFLKFPSNFPPVSFYFLPFP